MDIKVIGMGCEKCDKLYANVQEAIRETKAEVTLEKVEDLIEIVKLGVMSAPALMIDGKVVVAGKVPKKKEIVELLLQRL